MPSAMMFPAGVSLLAVSVVRTRSRRIVCRRAFEEGIYRLVRVTVHAAVDGHTRLRERVARPARNVRFRER